MDPIAFLEETDPLRRALMQGIAHAGRAIQREHDLERANQIAAEVSKLFRRSS